MALSDTERRRLTKIRNDKAEKAGEGTYFLKGDKTFTEVFVEATFYPKTHLWINESGPDSKHLREITLAELRANYNKLEI